MRCIQYYVYILFIRFDVYIIFCNDLVKRGVLTLVGEIRLCTMMMMMMMMMMMIKHLYVFRRRLQEDLNFVRILRFCTRLTLTFNPRVWSDLV